jgi:hypothetical protein
MFIKKWRSAFERREEIMLAIIAVLIPVVALPSMLGI